MQIKTVVTLPRKVRLWYLSSVKNVFSQVMLSVKTPSADATLSHTKLGDVETFSWVMLLALAIEESLFPLRVLAVCI